MDFYIKTVTFVLFCFKQINQSQWSAGLDGETFVRTHSWGLIITQWSLSFIQKSINQWHCIAGLVDVDTYVRTHTWRFEGSWVRQDFQTCKLRIKRTDSSRKKKIQKMTNIYSFPIAYCLLWFFFIICGGLLLNFQLIFTSLVNCARIMSSASELC